MITENKGNRELYYQGITYDETNMFFQKGMNFNVCMHIYTKDVVYIWNFNPGERAFLSGRQQTVELPSQHRKRTGGYNRSVRRQLFLQSLP